MRRAGLPVAQRSCTLALPARNGCRKHCEKDVRVGLAFKNVRTSTGVLGQ